MKEVKELVKNAEWQRVRESLLGKWKENPTWCCNKLKNFLGPLTKASDEKLKIMMNYLTGSGFRSGNIKANCVSNLRLQVSLEMKRRKKNK